MITVRKLKLTIVGTDEERRDKYKFIKDSQYAQYQSLNLAMGVLSSAYLESNRDVKSDVFKEAQKSLKNSNPIFEGITFGKGIDTLSSVTQRVKKDFSTSLKNGLARGERNFTNYRRTYPLMTRGRALKFSYDADNNILINWVNKITFKVVVGAKQGNKVELMHTLNKIIEGQTLLNEEKDKDIKKQLSEKVYTVGQSSFEFGKRNELILNLTLNIPDKDKKDFEIVEGRVLGVDLGVKYPAYVCLSDDTYVRESIGDVFELLKHREQFRERRSRLQSQLKLVKGGKGRKDKLKALDSLKSKERAFAKTYNHQISKRILDFAKKHNCEVIHLEDLSNNTFDTKLLSIWGYSELQQMIEYKAKREGIEVRYVNAAYTTQQCSCCGHISEDNVKSQSKFECVECGLKLNADHNASINIGRSTDIVK